MFLVYNGININPWGLGWLIIFTPLLDLELTLTTMPPLLVATPPMLCFSPLLLHELFLGCILKP